MMSYCSPSVSLNCPAGMPATARRTARSNSTAGTPSSAALCESMSRLRFVRRMRTGFSTSRVPGVSSMIFSTLAASSYRRSSSGPMTRIAIGAVIGGPLRNSLHVDARVRILLQLAAQLVERARRVASGRTSRASRTRPRSCCRLRCRSRCSRSSGCRARGWRSTTARPAARAACVSTKRKRAIGLGEAAAVRRLDRDQEVRRIGFREQAEADDGRRRRPSRPRMRPAKPTPSAWGAPARGAAAAGRSDGWRR